MSRYTFCMKFFFWALCIAAVGGLAYAVHAWRKRAEELQRASERRMTAFLAEARAAARANPEAALLAQQRLLLEAATKAAEAGEPALSIQLYARLIARYPESAFVAQARAAVEAQKKNIPRPRAPDTSVPG
jgi:hypothetical protein